MIKPIYDGYNIFIEWLRIRIRSPLSNKLSKGTFYVGALIVSTPLFEHLIFTAIFKKIFGIDFGITVPDTNAYIAGCGLIFLSLVHNLFYIKLTQDFINKQKEKKIEIYQELWEHVDTMIDDVARLARLYCTHFSEDDKKFALKAEESIKSTLEYVRRNRLVISSAAIYENIKDLSSDCGSHTRSFRACIQMKLRDDGSYDFYMAQRSINRELASMIGIYENVHQMIKSDLST
ncbi:hypothetical protein [Comamonas thiooxydans]|uniref:hypothetical protein n=1 Tax=Comamonas thiooxydans TaxID=363952 RepID=UPI0013DD096E|nr:hypothetical protein [Comamonas thiooxydans]